MSTRMHRFSLALNYLEMYYSKHSFTRTIRVRYSDRRDLALNDRAQLVFNDILK